MQTTCSQLTTPSQRRNNLVMDGVVATPTNMPSCRTQWPPLDMADAFVSPITMPSPSCGIAPQPAARGIPPQTAFTSHHRPPTHMESSAPSSLSQIDRL
jgi:hypothetical protein